MSDEQRTCPYCGAAMASDQRTCPDCNNPYPFDDEQVRAAPGRAETSRMSAAGGGPSDGPASGPPSGPLAALAPYRTILVLVGVLVLIVVVGYALFSIGMSFFASGRPDPGALATAPAGPVVTPPALLPSPGPGPGASPSPGTGTVISPSASPSPAASGTRLKVANTDGQGANMRRTPSTTAPIVKTLNEGTVVEAIGSEQQAEGRSWRNVRDQAGATGWVASELLAPE
ncbi:MAG: SH3 domain-containing protein [Chloroflexota bacterium]